MEFNTLLEHYGRDGYDISHSINLFLNSKKQIVIRYRRITPPHGYGWLGSTKYKFKMPSTTEDLSNIIHFAKSVTFCDTCKTVHSTIEHPTCPKCTMRKIMESANNIQVENNECPLCGNNCIKGMMGKLGRIKLTCGHGMCRECLEKIKKNGEKFYCTDNTIKTTISCPFCREKENIL